MRRILAIAAILFLWAGPCAHAQVAQDQCARPNVFKSVAISTAATTMTLIEPTVAGKSYRACNYALSVAGTSGTMQFFQGTQTTTPCDTNAVALSGIMPIGIYSPDGAIGLWETSVPGSQVCIQTTGAATLVEGHIALAYSPF
jgi:hypothetical protein